MVAAPWVSVARAQPPPFPTRLIRVIVPFPAGGGVDVFARPLAPALSEALGVPVVIENIGGAASRIGSLSVANAAPDGHTLLLTNDTLVAVDAVNPASSGPALLPSLRPVTLAIASCNLIVTHPKSGITDVSGYLDALKSRPGKVNVGVPGWGTAHHLTSAALNHQLGVTAEHIPYRGGAPLLADLLGGTLDVGVVTLAAALGHIQNGTLVGIAVTSKSRAPSLPGVPTLDESVAPGYEHLTWQGLLAPVSTPDSTIALIHAATVKALGHPSVQDKLPGLGFDPVARPGEPFGVLLDDTFKRFSAVVAATGIQSSRT